MAAASDARSAWASLCALGGFDLDERDADFKESLRAALNPIAGSFDEAVDAATTDELVRALFELIEPWAEMFRAILNFFRRAEVTEGRHHWQLVVDEVPLELIHFSEFLKTWDRVPSRYDVPALAGLTIWDVWRKLRDANAGSDGGSLSFSRDETYRPLPRQVAPGTVPQELEDVARILAAISSLIARRWRSREELMRDYLRRDDAGRILSMNQQDGFALGTIAQHETDYCRNQLLAGLLGALALPRPQLEQLSQEIRAILNPLPRRRIDFSSDEASLRSLLSLPVWRQRHELYAVWIATEIVAALPGHEIELHNEEGRIVFAFREADVATIHSSKPLRKLVAERLITPAFQLPYGRKGAQPDYGVWMEEHGKARCLLVIEVKHYKRDAPLRFEKVMHVYALAHPSAEIALVAHGPTREVATIGREGWTSRCHALGDLTPLNRPRRDELAQLVSAAVGPPVRPSIKGGARRTALLIDISGSMEEPLASKEFSSWLQTALSTDIAVVALVDTEIRHRCLPQEAERLIGSVANDRGTELEEPIAELLADYGEILLVTDEDGIRALAGNKLAGPPQNLGSGLSVIAIGDPPPVLPTNSAVANMPDGSTTSS